MLPPFIRKFYGSLRFVQPRREVAFPRVGADGDDQPARVFLPGGDLRGGGDRRARRDAHEQAVLPGDGAAGLERLPGRDGRDFVEHRTVEVCGDEVGADALDAVWTAAALGDKRRLGRFDRNEAWRLPERHLGLTTGTLDDALLDRMADAAEESIDLDRLLELARIPRPAAVVSAAAQATSGLRLGVAQDEAFHFYYEENFELLRERGVELVFFSPLHDRDLPPELDGLWFGGGYPELFAETLAANDAMLDAVRSFAASGRVVWGECGGFLYLLAGLTGFDGVRYPMLGLLPGEGKMHSRLSALGYREAVTAADGLFGPAGTRIQGHEFHYSSAELPAGTQPFFHARTLHGETSEAGSVHNRIAGSYLHLHFASNPAALDHFVKELAR